MSGGRVGLVIAETALELMPKELTKHSSVISHAVRLGKNPNEILLDRSFHHYAMISGKIEMAWKRGRPDIAHSSLLAALSTPLYLQGILDVYIHTIDDKVIMIGQDLRVPKSYFRFEGIMMKLYKEKTIRNNEGSKNLLELRDNTNFEYLINNIIGSDKIVGLTSVGARSTAEQVVFRNCRKSCGCTFVVGGFPKGHFSGSTSKLFSCSYSIERIALETHVVIARILYEYEKIMLHGNNKS